MTTKTVKLSPFNLPIGSKKFDPADYQPIHATGTVNGIRFVLDFDPEAVKDATCRMIVMLHPTDEYRNELTRRKVQLLCQINGAAVVGYVYGDFYDDKAFDHFIKWFNVGICNWVWSEGKQVKSTFQKLKINHALTIHGQIGPVIKR